MPRIAAARGCTVPQLAIAWLLAKKEVSSVLLGATKQHQLDDNLGAVKVKLAAEDLAELDAASAITPLYPSSDWIEPDPRSARALAPR